jgi:hypothetical protein
VLRKAGTEILTSHVVREAAGRDAVEAALVSEVDRDGRSFGAERIISCDGIVLGVGATPVVDLLDAMACRIAFQPTAAAMRPSSMPASAPACTMSLRSAIVPGSGRARRRIAPSPRRKGGARSRPSRQVWADRRRCGSSRSEPPAP